MRFTATWRSDGVPPIVLCKTSRDWMEVDPRLNHERLVDPAQPYQAEYATAFDRQNKRNHFAFNVHRGVNDLAKPFKDCGEAFLHLLDHPQSLPGSGTLKIEIADSATIGSRILEDAILQGVELIEATGVLIAWRYTFTGGAFQKSIQANP